MLTTDVLRTPSHAGGRPYYGGLHGDCPPEFVRLRGIEVAELKEGTTGRESVFEIKGTPTRSIERYFLCASPTEVLDHSGMTDSEG